MDFRLSSLQKSALREEPPVDVEPLSQRELLSVAEAVGATHPAVSIVRFDADDTPTRNAGLYAFLKTDNSSVTHLVLWCAGAIIVCRSTLPDSVLASVKLFLQQRSLPCNDIKSVAVCSERNEWSETRVALALITAAQAWTSGTGSSSVLMALADLPPSGSTLRYRDGSEGCAEGAAASLVRGTIPAAVTKGGVPYNKKLFLFI